MAALDGDGELPLLQRFSVGMRQSAYVKAKRPVRRGSNVEKSGEAAERTVRQHVVPPRIMLRGGHVVRHDVEEELQPLRARAVDEAAQAASPPKSSPMRLGSATS